MSIKVLRGFPPYYYLVLAILIRTITQILLKYIAIGESGSSFQALFTSPLFYFICSLLVILTWAWQRVLIHYPLSFAYPFTSIVFITLLISGALFFNEQITLANVIGSVIIVMGVIVVSRDKRNG